MTFPLYIEVDAIFNLPCPAPLVHYRKDPAQTTKTSAMGTINARDLAKRLKVSLVQVSASEVWGNPAIHP